MSHIILKEFFVDVVHIPLEVGEQKSKDIIRWLIYVKKLRYFVLINVPFSTASKHVEKKNRKIRDKTFDFRCVKCEMLFAKYLKPQQSVFG